MMTFDENTRIRDILEEYPWLPETVVRLDSRFRIINTPLGRTLIRHATLAEASRRSGYPLDQIIRELEKLIARHEQEAQKP